MCSHASLRTQHLTLNYPPHGQATKQMPGHTCAHATHTQRPFASHRPKLFAQHPARPHNTHHAYTHASYRLHQHSAPAPPTPPAGHQRNNSPHLSPHTPLTQHHTTCNSPGQASCTPPAPPGIPQGVAVTLLTSKLPHTSAATQGSKTPKSLPPPPLLAHPWQASLHLCGGGGVGGCGG